MTAAKIEPGSINIPVGTFPATCKTPKESINAHALATSILSRLNAAISTSKISDITVLFLEKGSFWRDHLCVSWDFHTAKGREGIASLLSQVEKEKLEQLKLELDISTPFRSPQVSAIDAFGDVIGVQFFITVSTAVGSGRGVVRLAETDEGEWYIYTLYTVLQELTGHEERVSSRRPFGAVHGEVCGRPRLNWQDRRDAETNLDENKEPAVLIVGAGQAGLSVAARLRMLGVDALIIDQEDRIGDNWRRRYHQLVLHDPVWFDHMPYLPFPSNWPVFTPKDKLAEFFECYVKLLELNVWTRTTVKEAKWHADGKEWTVEVIRRTDSGEEKRVLRPRHIIQATGHSGEKNLPEFKGIETFKGSRICHSSEFGGATDADPRDKGQRKAIVVGSCNSAHDIAQDYYEKSYDVTMVQRSSTCVISSEAVVNIGLKGLYEENGPPVHDSDVFLYSIPSEQFKAQQVKITAVQNKHDKDLLDGLEKAGFKVDKGPDDAGLLIKYWQRGGGYTIEVGAGKLIADGKIKVKQGEEIAEILPQGLRFADGSELEADEIVFATGYRNMREQTRRIFGDMVANRVNSVWGLDSEGEMRTIWRKTGHPGFWFMGGNLAMCRYYSLLLALQILGIERGLNEVQ
jgi:thioredoxin reductase